MKKFELDRALRSIKIGKGQVLSEKEARQIDKLYRSFWESNLKLSVEVTKQIQTLLKNWSTK